MDRPHLQVTKDCLDGVTIQVLGNEAGRRSAKWRAKWAGRAAEASMRNTGNAGKACAYAVGREAQWERERERGGVRT